MRTHTCTCTCMLRPCAMHTAHSTPRTHRTQTTCITLMHTQHTRKRFRRQRAQHAYTARMHSNLIRTRSRAHDALTRMQRIHASLSPNGAQEAPLFLHACAHSYAHPVLTRTHAEALRVPFALPRRCVCVCASVVPSRARARARHIYARVRGRRIARAHTHAQACCAIARTAKIAPCTRHT